MTNVQFYFDGVYYKQVDGVAMGSPLGPVLADIFMGYIEEKAAATIRHLPLYRRYVDDIFTICVSENQINDVHSCLNSLHPNLQFTVEKENANTLAFLDVMLTRRADGSLARRVYHKSTWSGQYLHFKSFAPVKYKRGVV